MQIVLHMFQKQCLQQMEQIYIIHLILVIIGLMLQILLIHISELFQQWNIVLWILPAPTKFMFLLKVIIGLLLDKQLDSQVLLFWDIRLILEVSQEHQIIQTLLHTIKIHGQLLPHSALSYHLAQLIMFITYILILRLEIQIFI